MLEHIPSALGATLSGLKAGLAKTAFHAAFPDVPDTITLTSPAFSDGADLPARFTADGEGLLPPLAWRGLPDGTDSVVLLVEDAGSPTPQPLVHFIAWDIPPDPPRLGAEALSEGGLPGEAPRMGRNSFLHTGWLPPDPPSGHGRHAYVFQIYALRQPLRLAERSGRGALLQAMRGRVMARGHLIGTYSRV